MRKIFIAIITVCIGLTIGLQYSCNSSKPTNNTNKYSRNSLVFFKGDTVAYLNNLIKNKSIYVGKPISYLIQDIKYPIKSFATSITPDKRISLGLALIAGDDNYHK